MPCLRLSFRRVLLCCPLVDVRLVFAGAQLDLRSDGQAPQFLPDPNPKSLGLQCLALGHHRRLPAWSLWHSSPPTTTRTAPTESTVGTGGNMRHHSFPSFLCVCELLICLWWEGIKRSATFGRDNSRRNDTNNTHGNNDKGNNERTERTARAERNGRGRTQVASPSPPQPQVLLRCPHPSTSLKEIRVVECHPLVHARLPFGGISDSWHTDDDDTTCMRWVRVIAPHPTKPNDEESSPSYDLMGWEGRNRQPGTGASGNICKSGSPPSLPSLHHQHPRPRPFPSHPRHQPHTHANGSCCSLVPG